MHLTGCFWPTYSQPILYHSRLGTGEYISLTGRSIAQTAKSSKKDKNTKQKWKYKTKQPKDSTGNVNRAAKQEIFQRRRLLLPWKGTLQAFNLIAAAQNIMTFKNTFLCFTLQLTQKENILV